MQGRADRRTPGLAHAGRPIPPGGICAKREVSASHVACYRWVGSTGPREPVPAPARARHPRRPDAAQPRRDGLDAHRARGPPVGPAEADGVRRRARPRRGRPDHHRRLLAHQARLAQAVRGRDDHAAAGDAAPRPDRRRARRGRRDRDAGAARGSLRLPPVQRQRVGEEVADHAVPAERPVHQGRRRHGLGLRALGRAGPQGGLRRGRDHGLGGLPGQPVPRRPHQRPHRPLGRVRRQPDAVRGRGRAPVRGTSCPRASRSSTGSRCSTWSRAARPGTRSSSSRTCWRTPASPCSTPASAGTRRGCRRSSPRSRPAPGAR